MPAQVYICQGGCGAFEPDASKMQARGIVNEKLYCEVCIGYIDDYIRARDLLHTQLAQEWSEGLVELANEFAVGGRKLPDA